MAQVVKNPDNTLTVTLTPQDQKVMQRWAAEHNVQPVKQFEDIVNGFLQNKFNDLRGSDGMTMRQKYDALSPAQQTQVDTLLGS